MKYVLLLLAILFGFVAGFSSGYYYLKYQETLKLVSEQKQQKPINLDAYKIYNLVNDYRASKGLSKLDLSPKICEYSEKRLFDIHKSWTHNGYKENPPNYSKYPGAYTGENIAKGQTSEKELVDSWIKSPEHLVNIINPNFKLTCVSSDYHSLYEEVTSFTVQEFASF